MKKLWLMGAVAVFSLSACAHADKDSKEELVKPNAEETKAKCANGSTNPPKCTTGGGATTGPVVGDGGGEIDQN